MKKTYSQFTLIAVLALSMTAVKRVEAQTWSALGTGLDIGVCQGSVDALLLFRGELWAGGYFFAPGTGNLIDVARWDGANWTSVGGGVDNRVFAMAALNADRFVAGEFTAAGGVPGFNRIARWNGTAWNTLGTGLNGVVYALASRGTRLYVGGAFTTAGGVTRNRIAYWDTANNGSWHSMGVGFPSGNVYAIAVSDNGTVYAGGDFPDRIASYDEIQQIWNGLPDPPSGGPIVDVRAIVARGAGLDVGGRFTTVGNPPLTVRGLAYWSGASWFSYPTPPWNPSDATPPGQVRAIAWNGSSQMYVTGVLQNTTPSSFMQNIFVLENGVWSQSKPSPGLNIAQCSTVGQALAANRFNGRVYVGGVFDTAGGIASPNVALWTEFKPYIITDLGTLSAGTYSVGLALNNRGESGGFSQVFTNGNFRDHGFFNTGGGSLYDFGGNWGGDDASSVQGMNDSTIFVGTIDNFGAGSYVRAFRNALPGTWNLLEPFSGGTRSEGLAINNNNDAVGISRNSSGVDRATRWVSSTTIGDDLGSLVLGGGPGFPSYAYGVNAWAYVVGKSRYSTANNFFHAFRCSPTADITPPGDDLGTMGGNESIAYAINDVGQIVGGAQNASGQWRAFIKVPDTGTGAGFIDLGAGIAYAINNNSSPQVVGSAPFIWQNELGRINLSALLPVGSQWTIESVEAINDYGQIVGYGSNGGPWNHGFIMSP